MKRSDNLGPTSLADMCAVTTSGKVVTVKTTRTEHVHPVGGYGDDFCIDVIIFVISFVSDRTICQIRVGPTARLLPRE